MPTLLPNTRTPLILQPGLALTLSMSSLASAKLTELDGLGMPIQSVSYTLNPSVVGPFANPKVFFLDAVNGTVTYSVGLKDERFQETRILAQSGVAVPTVNNTSEQFLATIPIPGGTIGPNGSIRVWSLWTFTNNVNAKTVRVRLGGEAGTVFAAIAAASALSLKQQCMIFNRGAQNAQVGQVDNSSIFQPSTSALVTGAIDTSVDTTVVLSAQKATGTDTATLEAYVAEVIPGFV